ncbi:hypothetical protein PybrP1_007171 [[Pythium] brassicae (nom. inval.)]|nr:hypothetical protein PybrP1_007171 [[Pythium] brassicae (nom. inval.)]
MAAAAALFEDATRLQREGNALYGSGHYADARASYSAALALLEASTTSTEASTAIAQLLSNRAQTFVQERDFAAALHDCTKALKHDPLNEKAALRRLVALENLERFEAASALVDDVLARRGASKHAPALFQYAVTAQRRLRKTLARDEAAAKSEASQLGKMVHEDQQLRINIGSLVPSTMVLGEFVEVAVHIGNEFGLFRRSSVLPGERVYLQCALRHNADAAFTLAFRAADDADNADERAVRADGRLALNNRGKAAFRVAVVAADAAPTAAAAAAASRARMALQVTVHADSRAAWSLFPVVSLPFDVAPPPTAAAAAGRAVQPANALGVHCCRPIALAGVGREVLLAESPGNLGIGGKLWDSCLVLARYLALHRPLVAGKRVVELGSGLGLVGIVCALLGARATLTDVAEVVPLLRYNIDLNFPASSSDSDSDGSAASGGGRPTAATHLWGTEPAALATPHPDVVVLSDVVYDPEGYAPLVASLVALTMERTVVLMAHRSRNPMEHQFFELLGAQFALERVDWASEFAAAGGEEEPAARSARAAGDEQSQRGALQDAKGRP